MFFKISGSVNTKRDKSVIVELQHITRKRFIPMTQFTTELLNFLAQKQLRIMSLLFMSEA